MRTRLLMLVGAASATAALAAMLPARIAGQSQSGHPDLTGTYDLAMLTPLERPNGLPAVLSDEEAAKREKEAEEKVVEGDAKISGDRTAPPKGGDGSVGAAGNVGGYNTFWLDGGPKFPKINGQPRTSIGREP